jgi:SAM-dependent methyltransferase
MVDARLFESAALYYRRYRRGYSPAVFDFLLEELQPPADAVALDLGCGTGQIALELARRGLTVFAADPDAEMLAEGLREDASRKQPGTRWCLGSSETLAELRLPKLFLCTMGASFHWMDRAHVLSLLDAMIVPGGAVAVISGGTSAWSGPETGWRPIVRGVVTDFLGPQRRAGTGTYKHPDKRHETMLAESCFSRVMHRKLTQTERLEVDEIIGLQLSTSYASPMQFGSRLDEFRTTLRAQLLAAEPAGVFSVATETEVLLARRS